MDQLDNLKDIWKNQQTSDIQFSDKDILGMIHKKSSSMVKWILIISILEFLLPNILFLFSDSNTTKVFYENYNLTNTIKYYSYLHIAIILVFIFCFYKNYKNISVETSVKSMLKNILQTRKTVKYYIYYNIAMAAIIGLHIFIVVFGSETFKAKLPENTDMLNVWVVSILLFALVLFLFWGFYRLLYGFLLRKLYRNYKELQSK